MNNFIKHILFVILMIMIILIFSIANTANAEKDYAMSVLTAGSGTDFRGDPVNVRLM